MTDNKTYLVRHSEHIIKRHIKIQGTKSPYDGDWVYWGNRLKKMLEKPKIIINLLKSQQNKCSHCSLWFKSDDKLEINHKDLNKKNNMYKNLPLLHVYCYKNLHKSMYDKHQIERSHMTENCQVRFWSQGEKGAFFLLD